MKNKLDSILQQAVTKVPNAIAVVTNKQDIIYEGCAGIRRYGTPALAAIDDIMAIFSATELFTLVCALKLIEEGQLSFSDPASMYVPEINKLPLLVGFDDQGVPITRPATNAITVKDLMFHTSGLGNHAHHMDDVKYRVYHCIPMIISGRFESLQSALLHEPGTQHIRGTGVSWLGLIIERICNQRLGEVMKQQIFDPLGMHDTAFTMTSEMRKRRSIFHEITKAGKTRFYGDLELPQPPKMDMGGSGLYSTARDFSKFIRMLLNHGGEVLSSDSVKLLELDGTSQTALVNSFYWIDIANSVGGFWGSQMVEFHGDINDYSSYSSFESFKEIAYESK